MLRNSRAHFNYYPLGRRAGPINAHERLGEQNNLVARTWKPPDQKKITHTTRDRLKLDCPLCKFKWDYETLTVHCPAVDSHNKREHWLEPFWFYKGKQPYRYYKSMPVTFNPRTHQIMADNFAASNSNERRGEGLTTRARMLAREKQGMARYVSGIGDVYTQWETHFPYPS